MAMKINSELLVDLEGSGGYILSGALGHALRIIVIIVDSAGFLEKISPENLRGWIH